MFWGAKFFLKYCSVRTKKLYKIKLKIFFLILGKKIIWFKLDLSPQNFRCDVLYPFYSGEYNSMCWYITAEFSIFADVQLSSLHNRSAVLSDATHNTVALCWSTLSEAWIKYFILYFSKVRETKLTIHTSAFFFFEKTCTSKLCLIKFRFIFMLWCLAQLLHILT